MTEAKRRACETARRFGRLGGHGSHRKYHLFQIACCRRVAHLWKKTGFDKCLDAAERYAEGRTTDATVMRWGGKAAALHEGSPRAGQAELWARRALRCVLSPHRFEGWKDTSEQVAGALAAEAGHRPGSDTWNEAVEEARRSLALLLRDVTGDRFRPVALDPAWLAWNGGLVVRIAEGMYEDADFDRLPALADALEEAGCTNADLLAHCRGPGPHARGCWAIDSILGKS